MRRATFVLALLLFALPSIAERKPGAVSGTVLHEDVPLPGTTVRLLEGGNVVLEATTNVDGHYLLDEVPGGYYNLEISLEGMVPVTREVYVNGGLTAVEPVLLELAEFETITFSCGSPCDGEGEPTCEEYEANRGLEDVAAGDSRAIAQLRERYLRTSSREERARIGGFLVGILKSDEEHYAPLAASADMLLSFAERSSEESLDTDFPDYLAWCASTGRNADDELWMLYDETFALLGSGDLRVVHLAHRALRVNDRSLRYAAVAYAALTCDASLLAAVDDDFEALEETFGVQRLAEVVPCGDPRLNERIIALDPEQVARILPDIVKVRSEELARLGKASTP